MKITPTIEAARDTVLMHTREEEEIAARDAAAGINTTRAAQSTKKKRVTTIATIIATIVMNTPRGVEGDGEEKRGTATGHVTVRTLDEIGTEGRNGCRKKNGKKKEAAVDANGVDIGKGSAVEAERELTLGMRDSGTETKGKEKGKGKGKGKDKDEGTGNRIEGNLVALYA